MTNYEKDNKNVSVLLATTIPSTIYVYVYYAWEYYIVTNFSAEASMTGAWY